MTAQRGRSPRALDMALVSSIRQPLRPRRWQNRGRKAIGSSRPPKRISPRTRRTGRSRSNAIASDQDLRRARRQISETACCPRSGVPLAQRFRRTRDWVAPLRRHSDSDCVAQYQAYVRSGTRSALKGPQILVLGRLVAITCCLAKPSRPAQTEAVHGN